MADRTVAVRLRARVDAYQADLRKAAAETKAFSTKASSGMKSVTKATADLGPAARVSAGIALAAMGAFAAKSISAASDLNETISKTGVLFGASAGKIESWASTASTSLGQSKKQAMDAAASFAVFGKSAGLSGDALVEFSKRNVELASDMASFFNTSPEDAIQAIGSAFRGEAEPIRAYGVLLDDASMRQQALEDGIISSTKNALTPQQKVLAAQALIMKQTASAQGDFARTSDGLANSQRILAAQFEDTQAQLGQALLPVALKATSVMGALLKTVNGLPEPLKLTAGAAAAVAAGFIVLAPRIVSTVEAVKQLEETSPRAAAGVKRLGLAIAAIGTGVVVTEALSFGFRKLFEVIDGGTPELDALDRELKALMSGSAGAAPEVEKVAGALFFLKDRGEQARQGLAAGIFALPALKARFEESNEAVAAFDQTLAQMVANGDLVAAAQSVNALGLSVDETRQYLPEYSDALRGMTKPTAEANTLTALFAEKAKAAKDALAALTAITKAWQGVADRGEAADAMAAGFETLATAVKKNGGSLAGTTDAAREARSAFRSSMGDIAAYADTFKDPQARADALRGGLTTMRARLKAMGLSAGEIASITKPYQRLADEAGKAAAAQDKIDRRIDIAVHTTYSRSGTAPAPNGGGKVIEPATGGFIVGPGTGTSDSIPAMVSNGEYVVKASSVAKYGVDFLHELNAGTLGGFARGGGVGPRATETPAQKRARERREAAVGRVRDLKDAKQSTADSVAGSMRDAYSLKGSFDFGAQARAIDDLAAAEERLSAATRGVADADDAVFEARRAVNSAGTPKERADAEKKLAEALKAQAKARDDQAAAEVGVGDARKAVAKAAPTRENILEAWKGKLTALKAFNSNLKLLRKRGFSSRIVAQIASDPDGAELAAALANASPQQVKQFNSVDEQIADLSGDIGRLAGGAEYDDKIRKAQLDALKLGAGPAQVGKLVSPFQVVPQRSTGAVQVQLQVGAKQLASVLVDIDRRTGGVDGQ